MKKICNICKKEFEAKSNRKYCYDCENLPCSNCGKSFKASEYQREQFKDGKNIYCSRECINEGMPKTHKENMINKYGTEHYFNHNKYKETMNERYGVSYPMQSKELHQKFKESMNAKYGVNYSGQSQELLKKAQNTYMKRTGFSSTFSNPEVIEKSKKTMIKKYGNTKFVNIEKAKITSLKRYNRLYSSQRNISDESYHILNNRDKFKNYILNLEEKDRTIANLSNKLGLCESQMITLFYHKYRLDGEIKLYRHRSLKEDELFNYLVSIGVEPNDIIRNTRKVISPLELDLYLPKYNLAIEYNGIWYHNINSNHIKDKNYHYNKSKLCEEKGIRLIHIWDFEWEDKRQRPILENIIKSAIGHVENKIYARKCSIVIKKSNEMIDFFDSNNIQGFRGGKFAICLEYKGEIVMSYMMGYPFFSKGKYEWEVIRGATKLNTTVIGGASKIFKYFINNYNPKNCLYYIDYNYFNGNSLEHIDGMRFIKSQISFKNYFIEEGIVKNRNPLKHKELKKLEEENKVMPFYNAGTKVYLWENL